MITIDTLKKAILKKGYKWFDDQINLIAVRTKLQVPDAFNDLLFMVYKEADIEKIYVATITTEPGTTYQKKLLNAKGCFVMMPNQMIDAYQLGNHQNKEDHRCLRSVGKIYGQREDDKDGVLFNDPDATPKWEEGYAVGANIHGAYHNEEKHIDTTAVVGPWSAGCQVHNKWSKKEEMCDIAEAYKNINKGRITYTLLLESDLV